MATLFRNNKNFVMLAKSNYIQHLAAILRYTPKAKKKKKKKLFQCSTSYTKENLACITELKTDFNFNKNNTCNPIFFLLSQKHLYKHKVVTFLIKKKKQNITNN